ncbi:hypothetical protein GQ457_08G022360 [Hibiscus cannabinus]
MELGFSDDSPQLQQTRVISSVRTNCDKVGSSSGSSSESEKSQSSAKAVRSWTQVEEEAMEAILLGKDHNNDEGVWGKEDDRHLGDVDILGCSPIKVSADNDNNLKGDVKLKEKLEEIEKVREKEERIISEGGKEDPLESLNENPRTNLSPNYSWADVAKREAKEKNKTEEMIRADVVALGFDKNEINILEEDPNVDLEECFDSIKHIEKREDFGTLFSIPINQFEKRKRDITSERAEEDRVQESEKESFDRFVLPEFHVSSSIVNSKGRRYGSMLAIQEGSLTEAEKRKRDRARRRQKKKVKGESPSELEGRSISDSDIQARKEILLLEAQRTLEVGKKVGIDFIGNKEAVKEKLIDSRAASSFPVELEEKEVDNFIDACNLEEIPMLGRKFTWIGSGGKRSKIVRFLAELYVQGLGVRSIKGAELSWCEGCGFFLAVPRLCI